VNFKAEHIIRHANFQAVSWQDNVRWWQPAAKMS